jgi:hypothetical protein
MKAVLKKAGEKRNRKINYENIKKAVNLQSA